MRSLLSIVVLMCLSACEPDSGHYPPGASGPTGTGRTSPPPAPIDAGPDSGVSDPDSSTPKLSCGETPELFCQYDDGFANCCNDEFIECPADYPYWCPSNYLCWIELTTCVDFSTCEYQAIPCSYE